MAAAGATLTPERGLYRHYVLALLTGIYAVNVVDRFVVSVVTEDLKAFFHISDALIGALSGIGFALIYAILGIPIAFAADRTNRRNIVAGSIALFSAATLACGMAMNFVQLLLARLVVGIGEAGTSPPSHSMISDLYGPKSRAAALGVISMGPNIGMLIAFMCGGWITGTFGWRATFLTAGVPGLILALLLVLTVREPVRGIQDVGHQRSEVVPSSLDVFRFLLKRRSFVQLTIAASLWSFVNYGATQWATPFLIRAHGLDVATVGTIVGLLLGIAGGAGSFLGGFFAGHFGAANPRFYMLLPVGVLLVAMPSLPGFYLIPSTPLAIASFAVFSMMNVGYFAPCLATLQNLVPGRMRATTSAIFLSIVNVVGLTLGPTTVGILSDLYRTMIDVSSIAPEHAQNYAKAEGLRWALVTCSSIGLWAVFHFYMASRTLTDDLARVHEM